MGGMNKNRLKVVISVEDCDRNKQDEIIKRINDEKLDAIRDILDESTATIVYPTLNSFNERLGFELNPRISNIISYVQIKEDFEVEASATKVTTPDKT